jgi:hypothetical protein
MRGDPLLSTPLRNASNFGILMALPFSLWQQREVSEMNNLDNFLLAVIAGIVSYYVCKWLDGWRKGR